MSILDSVYKHTHYRLKVCLFNLEIIVKKKWAEMRYDPLSKTNVT